MAMPAALATILLISSLLSSAFAQRHEKPCRKNGSLVSGPVIVDNSTQMINSEQACVDKCSAMPECKAVNYIADNNTCTLHRQSVLTGRAALQVEPHQTAVYIVVKGCDERNAEPIPQPEPPEREWNQVASALDADHEDPAHGSQQYSLDQQVEPGGHSLQEGHKSEGDGEEEYSENEDK